MRTSRTRLSTAKSTSAHWPSEFFALGLDPYPRKPGVAFEPPVEPEPQATPFAVLRGDEKNA